MRILPESHFTRVLQTERTKLVELGRALYRHYANQLNVSDLRVQPFDSKLSTVSGGMILSGLQANGSAVDQPRPSSVKPKQHRQKVSKLIFYQ